MYGLAAHVVGTFCFIGFPPSAHIQKHAGYGAGIDPVVPTQNLNNAGNEAVTFLSKGIFDVLTANLVLKRGRAE